MKSIGKPCTGEPYARFDEGGVVAESKTQSPQLYSTPFPFLAPGLFFLQKVF